MKVTLELEPDEEGRFDSAVFRVPKNEYFFQELCESVNQFVYPFVDGAPAAKHLLQEMLADVLDTDDYIRTIGLDGFSSESLEYLLEQVKKQIKKEKEREQNNVSTRINHS